MQLSSLEAKKMPLSTYHLKIKFLFDENVDARLAEFSKLEERVFVTNDEDFIKFCNNKIFSLIWLKIPQRNIESLKNSFSGIINEIDPKNFKGNLITLYEDKFEISPLFSERKFSE